MTTTPGLFIGPVFPAGAILTLKCRIYVEPLPLPQRVSNGFPGSCLPTQDPLSEHRPAIGFARSASKTVNGAAGFLPGTTPS